MVAAPKTSIGTLVIDSKNWDRMISFWKSALGHRLRRGPEEWGSDEIPAGDWALIADPRGRGPNLAFQKDPNGPGAVYWFHFDLFSSDPRSEVERLVELGATVIQPVREGFDYVTLADPDGNPVDVLTEVIPRSETV